MGNGKFKIFLTIVSNMLLLFGQADLENLISRATSKMNIPLSDLKIEKKDLEFWGYGKFRTKLYDRLIDNPLDTDPFVRTLAHAILTNADSLWALSYFPWARIDEGVRRGLTERPEETIIQNLPKNDTLDNALIHLLNDFYGVTEVAIEKIPESIRLGLYMILIGIKNSCPWLECGNKYLAREIIDTIVKGLTESDEYDLSNPRLEELISRTDFKALAAGAMDLCYILGAAIDRMRDASLPQKLTLHTRLGTIVLSTIDDDTFDEKNYLLIIDFGGNDTYHTGGISSPDQPISIIIDYHGDDRYEGEIGCGTGIAGYGLVVDLEGNDKYQAKKFGLGTGILGQGIIMDYSGDDEYLTDLYGQGAGVLGAGVIADISGNDRYIGFYACQGFGHVKGAGLLIDKEGDDIYIARDDTIKYPSAQTAEHNISLAQGMGFGIRADYTDGHSLAGGIGMLIDGDGNDKYSCGVFGQGCGYWFGSGFLVDYSGNDEYNGIWYVQGAGAHFALGVLIDSAGNDRYNAAKNMALGAGHDFSLGVLIEYNGYDRYEAPNLSLGAGNANGMGIFVDLCGDDHYSTHGGITLGNSSATSRGGLRDLMKTIGIFIDGGGKDKYTEPFAGNSRCWYQKSPLEPPIKTELKIGVDF